MPCAQLHPVSARSLVPGAVSSAESQYHSNMYRLWHENTLNILRQSLFCSAIVETIGDNDYAHSAAEDFEANVINRTCRPVRHSPVVSSNFRDFYAFCTLRLLLAAEENINGTDPNNILFDLAIGGSCSHSALTLLD